MLLSLLGLVPVVIGVPWRWTAWSLIEASDELRPHSVGYSLWGDATNIWGEFGSDSRLIHAIEW